LKAKLPLAGALLGLLGLVLLLGTADTAYATFNPTLEVVIENPEPEVPSNVTADFNLPEGDVNFAAVVSFIPGDWGVVPGDQIPIGTIVGSLTSEATLGLINGPCDNVLPVQFTFLNSSIDPSDTVPFLDTDPEPGEEGYDPLNPGNGIEDFAEDRDDSGLPDAFEKYPDFITRVLDDENGNPLQPIRRAAGITIVAGVTVLLQFLVFEPGTFIDEKIPDDEELGYPSVILLQNAGDPEFDPIPGAITDFCTPLLSSNTTFAVSKDNGCTDDVPIEELAPICAATGVEVVEEGGTTPDEGGLTLFTNPQDGTYTFTIIAAGQRDTDGDGFENSLDTCAFLPNVGNARIGGDGDADDDGLDAACDPNDDRAADGTNSDEDLDGYTNRQDNCPLKPNGEDQDNQRDTDDDTIGDACDPNPDDADAQGEITIVEVNQDLVIGTGQGPGGPPSGFDQGGGDDGGGDDGGLSTGVLIGIIIGVAAGVIIVGGGVFAYLRRSRA